ncbi:sensor histidine kinase [Nocardioides deserti]|uniref:Sensor-like histidine kinase SenX3 n=1 Tax=Nocardioides deserti TaxID=1588644 RepID=A0ABR6U7M1_9ACTN|nr:ATP-binding protein [Nocardioides deserti]MBC2960424.1 hypothetical protein [Nocardioides deserti]GGO71427.1 hypothetical protein GCM10012276_12370 [Nocardioides deserti]
MRRWLDRGAGDGRTVLALVLVLTVPLLLLGWLVPSARDLDRAALSYELLVYPSVLVAGLLFYVCWRMSGNPTTAWLAAGVTVVGAQGVGLAAVRLAQPTAFAAHAGWMTGIDLALQALVVAGTVLAARRPLHVDPFLAGLVVGAVVTALRATALDLPALGLSGTALRGLAVLLFVGQACAALLLTRLSGAPGWVRLRIGLASVALGFSQLVLAPGLFEDLEAALATVLRIGGAVVLIHTALALLQVNTRRYGSTVRSLHRRMEHLEADARVNRERLHEIGATIAGIANVSQVLHTHPGISPDRRRHLEQAMDAEASRLQRLMDDRRTTRFEQADLDAVLEPLVTAHQARGRQVAWAPSQVKALCRPDDVAEVVNILLENAAQHARTACTLEVDHAADVIEIRVGDDGPGVPADLAGTIFDWGRSGPASTGQGIGLHIAHRLMVEQGGDLRLEPAPPGQGATFVAVLPGEVPE